MKMVSQLERKEEGPREIDFLHASNSKNEQSYHNRKQLPQLLFLYRSSLATFSIFQNFFIDIEVYCFDCCQRVVFVSRRRLRSDRRPARQPPREHQASAQLPQPRPRRSLPQEDAAYKSLQVLKSHLRRTQISRSRFWASGTPQYRR